MKIWMFILLTLVTGCVGTIEDPDKVDKSSQELEDPNFKFNGAYSAIAISHKGFQVNFKPAQGGSGIFDYNLYVDGNYSVSVGSLASENTGIDVNGNLNILVNTLIFRANTYSLVVRARDRVSAIEDQNTKSIVMPVLQHETPLFYGISNIQNVQGSLGKTSLTVSWAPALPARVSDDMFNPITKWSILGYTIYFKKAGSASVNTVFVANAAATSYTVAGLDPNTLYHIWVRAKDRQDPSLEDGNMIIRSKSTQPDKPIKFAGIVSGSVPSSSAGLDHIIATWAPASGNFTQYRIFYTTDPYETIDPVLDSVTVNFVDVKVTAANPNISSYQFPVDSPNTLYRVFVIACDDTCSAGGFDPDSTLVYASVTTTPPTAPFMGTVGMNLGIDTTELYWVFYPDESLGAYDGYRVTMRKGGVLIDEVLETTSPNEKLLTTPAKSAKKIKIIGLTEGESYCFKVESLLGAVTYQNSSWICGTPQYVKPDKPTFIAEDYLNDLSQVAQRFCREPVATGFKLRWKGPGVGTFTKYELFLQTGTEIDWDAPPTAIIPLVPGHDENTVYNYSHDGETPGTVVKVGIRTVYENMLMQTFYGQKGNDFNCTVEIQKVISQGWESILSIGLKENVMENDNNGVIPESFTVVNDVFATPEYLDAAAFPYQDVVRGTTNGAIKAEFSWPSDYKLLSKNYDVSPDIIPPTIANSSLGGGMVRLAWKDFKFQTGENFSAGAPVTIGYRVYRQVYKNIHTTNPPGPDDVNWTELTTSVVQAQFVDFPGTPKPGFYQADYIDYTIPAATSDPAKDAQLFWYKVEPYIGATKVDLVSLPGDYILKVVVPPPNMAMGHRWMMNKEACERLGKISDRNNAYRCFYNGLGSRRYTALGPLYLDFMGHVLMDRFELGCNFNQDAACVDGGGVGVGEKGDQNNDPAICGLPGSPCSNRDLGLDVALAGDRTKKCIGYPSNGISLTSTQGNTGHVWYNRLVARNATISGAAVRVPAESCWVKMANPHYWKGLEEAIALDPTVIDQSVANPVVSNKAGLPPLTMVSQSSMSKICGEFSVKLRSDTNDLKTYNKRLPRKQEYVAFMADPVEAPIYENYYEGTLGARHNMGCNTKHGFSAGAARGVATTAAAHELNHSKSSLGFYGQKADQLDLNHFRYPRTTIFDTTPGTATQNGLYYPRTGPVFATGSQGADSTAGCTFRYGVQDLIGNVPEWSGEVFTCANGAQCYPNKVNGLDSEDPDIIDKALLLGSDQDKKLNFSTEQDPGINRTGMYFYDPNLLVSSARNPIAYLGVDTVLNQHLLNRAAHPTGHSRNLFTIAPYFNNFVGIPLFCQDNPDNGNINSCDGAEDSMKNTMLATVADRTFWNVNLPPTQYLPTTAMNDMARVDIFSNMTDYSTFPYMSPAGFTNKDVAMVVGGFPCNATSIQANGTNPVHAHFTVQSCESNNVAQGRYSFAAAMSTLKYPDVGGRCATLIEEDEGGSIVLP
jgi:hypothetical protein